MSLIEFISFGRRSLGTFCASFVTLSSEALMTRVFLFVLFGIFSIFGLTSNAAAQNDQQLFLSIYQHLEPGSFDAWETARKERLEVYEQHNYPFQDFVSLSSDGVARINIRLANGWEDMEKRRTWFQSLPASARSSFQNRNNGVRYMVQHIGRPQPDLFYVPDSPRLEQGEANMFHEIRLYTTPGSGQEVRATLASIASLMAAHELSDPRFVRFNFVGGEGLSYSVFTPAESAAAYFEQSESNSETMGADWQQLLAELGANLRKVERINWAGRRDLSYTP